MKQIKFLILILSLVALSACGSEVFQEPPATADEGGVPSDEVAAIVKENPIKISKVDLLVDDQMFDSAIPLQLCLAEQVNLYLKLTDQQNQTYLVQNEFQGKGIQWFNFGPALFSISEAGQLTASKVGYTYLIVLHPGFGRSYLVKIWDCSLAPTPNPTPKPSPTPIVTPTPTPTPTPTEEPIPTEPPPPPPPVIEEDPNESKIVTGFKVEPQLVIMGELNDNGAQFYRIFSDGTQAPLNEQQKMTLSFTSTDSQIAQLHQNGNISGNQAGCARIGVSWGGYQQVVYVARDLAPLEQHFDAFADRVVCFLPGAGGGFGSSKLPDVVLGSPKGAGLLFAGLDVLSLGTNGEIILESESFAFDGPGADFMVFENPFLIGGNPNNPFKELGTVSVSHDGEAFVDFACDAGNAALLYPGCAGVHPVQANPNNNIDPTDPNTAGGDAFDLNQVGVGSIKVVKITDLDNGGGGGAAGFDLDAVSFRYLE